MSKPGDEVQRPERAAFKRLEKAVTEALGRIEELGARAAEAESRGEELGELVMRFTQDEGAAGRLLTRLKTLEQENADLRGRLETGREGVERLLAKIRFLEEQR